MQEPLDLLKAEIDGSDFQYAFSSRNSDGLHYLYDDGVNTSIVLSPIFRKYMDIVDADTIYWPTSIELEGAGFDSVEDYDKWVKKLEGQPFLLSFRMKQD
ncbi:MAG TPA: hypothetical protein VJB05_01930 [archaeon]|nr:hypothetical protein [archaeon]